MNTVGWSAVRGEKLSNIRGSARDSCFASLHHTNQIIPNQRTLSRTCCLSQRVSHQRSAQVSDRYSQDPPRHSAFAATSIKSTLHAQTSNKPHPTEPQWEMKPISPQSSQERLANKAATTCLCATWCLLSGPDIVSNIAIRLRTLSETRNSKRHVVITANHVPSDSSAKSGENCYIDTPVFAMPRNQLGQASIQTSLNKSNLYKRYQTTALHV